MKRHKVPGQFHCACSFYHPDGYDPQVVRLVPESECGYHKAQRRASQSEADQRDAARLDDMERTKCYPFWNGNGWTYIVAPEHSSKVERKGMGATVREAIDDAMRSFDIEEK